MNRIALVVAVTMLVSAPAFADASSPVVFDQVQYDLFALVIDLMAAILLLRVFTGKDNSRYLVHIAITFGILCLSHLLSTGLSMMRFFIEVQPGQMERLSERIDLLLSCLSTFFLILCFVLLLRYPRQNVPQSVFASMTGILGVFVALVTLIQGPADDSILLKSIDIFTSLGGAVCVGVGLIRIAHGQMSMIIGWITACFFITWGIAQLPFWFAFIDTEHHQMYFYSLTMAGFVSAIATVIFSAITLPDRRKFLSDATAPPSPP